MALRELEFLTTHYGPSFTWLSAALTWLSNGGVVRTAIGFKTMAALANLLSGWLIRDISARLGEGDGLDAFTLYALNPLVLFETAGIGHNEAVVVVFALAGVSLVLRDRPWLAVIALLLSADVKNVTASLALFFSVRFVFQAKGGRARGLRATAVLVISLLLAAALWVPFWPGSAFATSWALLTHGAGLRTGAAGQGFSRLRLILFVALLTGCAFASVRGSVSRVLNLSALVGMVFVLWIFPWRFAWYGIPPLALAIAARRSWANTMLLVAALAYGLILMQLYARLHLAEVSSLTAPGIRQPVAHQLSPCFNEGIFFCPKIRHLSQAHAPGFKMSPRLSDMIPVLQVAVAPVILISGVGLLLLSLTNRFGRAVDRARHLRRELRDATDVDRRH